MRKQSFILAGAALVLAAFVTMGCEGGGAKSWYVSVQGDDANKGNSEKKPFLTLTKAVTAASLSETVTTITVIGTLSGQTEGPIPEASFAIFNSGSREILITGKADATDQ